MLLPGNESVLIGGSATHLGGESVWIFVRRHKIYYVSNIKAILVMDGLWHFRDPYVGSSSNTGTFQINAVLANTSCTLVYKIRQAAARRRCCIQVIAARLSDPKFH